MAKDTTMCYGMNCNEKYECKRFLDGKKSDGTGWWFQGKDSPYEVCPDKVEEKENGND